MPRYKVFYYNVRDSHRLLTINLESWSILGVYHTFIKDFASKGDIYLSCIKVKMPKRNK